MAISGEQSKIISYKSTFIQTPLNSLLYYGIANSLVISKPKLTERVTCKCVASILVLRHLLFLLNDAKQLDEQSQLIFSMKVPSIPQRVHKYIVF